MFRGLATVYPLRLQVGAAEQRLRRDPTKVVAALEDLLRGATQGRAGDRVALLPCLIAMVGARSDPELVGRLVSVAQRDGRPLVHAILGESPPLRAISVHVRLHDPTLTAYDLGVLKGFSHVLAQVPVSTDDPSNTAEPQSSALVVSPVTLSWFRARMPHLRDKIRREPRTDVIGRILAGHCTSPGDAVAIAAARPSSAEILGAVAASLRFVAIHEVREALVFNPFTPPGIGLKLLPTLLAPLIRRVARGGPLHPSLTGLARDLVRIAGSPMG